MYSKLRKTGKVLLALVLAATGIAAMPEAILFLVAFTQIGDIPESERTEVLIRSAIYAVGVAAYIAAALWLLRPEKKLVGNDE